LGCSLRCRGHHGSSIICHLSTTFSRTFMSSLSTSFAGAFQGTVSVLLTLVAGYIAARLKLFDSHTIHQLSKLCSHVFLPCLIITAMGPGITASQLQLLWIIPVWGLTSSVLSHGIGFLGKVREFEITTFHEVEHTTRQSSVFRTGSSSRRGEQTLAGCLCYCFKV
jgi:hypothetical protein